MIRRILAFFGYVKVPGEAIELSRYNEKYLKAAAEVHQGDNVGEVFARMSEGQKAITEFLESGRMI